MFSIRTGAREMLLKLLKIDPTIVSDLMQKIGLGNTGLDVEYWSDAETYKEKSKTKAFEPMLEWLFSKTTEKGTIGTEMMNIAATNFAENPKLKLLKTILSFEIMAISYYSGLLFSVLDKAHDINGDDRNHDIAVDLCGNGSKVIKWIGPIDAVIPNINYFFKLGSVLEDANFKARFAGIPKTEVSFGLLKNTIPNIENIKKNYVVGENYLYHDKKYSFEKIIRLDEDFKVEDFNKDLPFFSVFADKLGIIKDEYNDDQNTPYVTKLGLYPIIFDNNINDSTFDKGRIILSLRQIRTYVHKIINNKNEKKPLFFIIIDAVKIQLKSPRIWGQI